MSGIIEQHEERIKELELIVSELRNKACSCSPKKEIYTRKELAKILKCHPETIRRKQKENFIPGVKRTGKCWFYNQETVDWFLEYGLSPSERAIAIGRRKRIG